MCELKVLPQVYKRLEVHIQPHPTQWVVKVSKLLAPFLAEALLGGLWFQGGLDFWFILLSL